MWNGPPRKATGRTRSRDRGHEGVGLAGISVLLGNRG